MKPEIISFILLFFFITQFGHSSEENTPELKPNQILILGWVKEPKAYTINEVESLMSCLLKAGGVMSEASLRKILIKKRTNENGQIKYIDYRVDLKAYVEELPKDDEDSIFWIEKGDVIYIPSGCLFPSEEYVNGFNKKMEEILKKEKKYLHK